MIILDNKGLKKRFKTFMALITLDELSEANRIIKFIGIAFILLSLLYILGFVKLSTIIIICISASGIFFIIGDIFEHCCKVQHTKKAIDLSIRYKKIGYFRLAKITCHFLAILSLIIAPYITINLTLEVLSKVSNALSMLAIGLTVFKIGLDNSMKKSEAEAKLADEMYQIMTQIDKKNE